MYVDTDPASALKRWQEERTPMYRDPIKWTHEPPQTSQRPATERRRVRGVRTGDDWKPGIQPDPAMKHPICRHPEHNPPNMIVIPPGCVLNHECPGCGHRCTVRGASYTLAQPPLTRGLRVREVF